MRRVKTGVRLAAAEREKARRWWASLSNADRWTLGDQLVLGDIDWHDWGFSKPPSSAFKNELDRERMLWESRDDNDNPRGHNPLEALRLLNPQANPQANPASSISPAVVRRYRTFHETDPQRVTERTMWVPGGLVLLGRGVEINYQVLADGSAKDKGAKYVHEFESGVKIYRRAQAGEQADLTWKNFPSDLMVLGRALEFSFESDDGTFETKPAAGDKLAAPPDGKFLVVVGSGGVKFLAKGGKMKVTDWIYH